VAELGCVDTVQTRGWNKRWRTGGFLDSHRKTVTIGAQVTCSVWLFQTREAATGKALSSIVLLKFFKIFIYLFKL